MGRMALSRSSRVRVDETAGFEVQTMSFIGLEIIFSDGEVMSDRR